MCAWEYTAKSFQPRNLIITYSIEQPMGAGLAGKMPTSIQDVRHPHPNQMDNNKRVKMIQQQTMQKAEQVQVTYCTNINGRALILEGTSPGFPSSLIFGTHGPHYTVTLHQHALLLRFNESTIIVAALVWRHDGSHPKRLSWHKGIGSMESCNIEICAFHSEWIMAPL